MFFIHLLNNFLSIIFPLIVCYLNCFILISIFYYKRTPVNPNMKLMYCKFGIDIIHMLFALTIEIYQLITEFRADLITKNVAFLLIWLASSISSLRSTLALSISLSRFIAVCFPIFFHKNQENISKFKMLLILLPDGLLNQILMFGLCENSINILLECDRFYCAVNSCYSVYWHLHEQTVCLLNVVFSIIISMRIIICNYCLKTTPTNKKLSKATRIALLDAFIVFFFNILPSYIFVHFPSINFESVGPVVTVIKTFGLVIEGLITCRVLFGDTQVSSNIAS